MIRVTFLGTGTSLGSPVIGCDCPACLSSDPRDGRLRTSALIEVVENITADAAGATSATDVTTIVVDAGPDFRQQMLRAGVRHVDGILLTHEHKDHVAGLDDVRALNHAMRGAVHIYATERVQQRVRTDFDYAFAELRYPGAPLIELHTIDNEAFTVVKQSYTSHHGESGAEAGGVGSGVKAHEENETVASDRLVAGSRVGVLVTPIRGMHARMPVTGFRIGKMAYLTDFGAIEDAEVEKLMGLDVLIVNALRKEKHLSHFSMAESLALAERTGAHRVFLTHVSHEMGFYEQIAREVPDNVQFAYDGLTVYV